MRDFEIWKIAKITLISASLINYYLLFTFHNKCYLHYCFIYLALFTISVSCEIFKNNPVFSKLLFPALFFALADAIILCSHCGICSSQKTNHKHIDGFSIANGKCRETPNTLAFKDSDMFCWNVVKWMQCYM